MKLFLCSFLVTLALGDRLEKTYIPPSSAKTAGGSGSFLSAPSFGGTTTAIFRSLNSDSSPVNSYIPPATGPVSSYESSPGQYSGAASQDGYSTGPQFRILKLDTENPGDGTYKFEYETENEISQHEAGEVRNAGGDQASSVVRGSYSYTAPDGQHITVNYIADENGFRPEGDHIPTPPPVPEDIKKSLDQISASGSSQNGGYSYQGSSESSGPYQGVEISRAASNQYLAPPIARHGSGAASSRQYLAPPAAKQEQRNNEAINRQYLAPNAARVEQGSYEAVNRQYLAPAVGRAGQGNNEATNRQYLAPGIARQGQGNNEVPNRQYLAPVAAKVEQRSYEPVNRQYLAPSVARQGQGNNEAPNRQYLAPVAARVEQESYEPVNRQYLAPAVARVGQGNNEAINRQYLAPVTSRAGQGSNEAPNRQYLAPAFSRTGLGNNKAANQQYLPPVVAKTSQENGGYRY